MVFSVVYFQIMHRLGRPHYVLDEYLYSVLNEVEVRVTMCKCLCSVIVLWHDDERKVEGETQCQLIACSSRNGARGSPGLMPPSDGRIAINSTICLLRLRKGLEFNPGL